MRQRPRISLNGGHISHTFAINASASFLLGACIGTPSVPSRVSDSQSQVSTHADECDAVLQEKWRATETYAAGQTGEVILRIELDEQGRTRNLRVIKGLTREVDMMAIGLFRFDPHCRFKPAVRKDGRPVPFVIERFTLQFERE